VKEALDRLSKVKVLVVGDLMVDRYQWGQVDRISPEAPVPVVKILREERRLGGAANVAGNLVALGCHAGLCGVVGQDEPGRVCLTMLERLGVAHQGVLESPARPTTEKLRIMGGEQQLLRVDQEDSGAMPDDLRNRLTAWLTEHLHEYDGAIVSDYAKGVVNETLLDVLLHAAKAHPRQPFRVVVDPKGQDYRQYHGVTSMTPNEHETAVAARRAIVSDADALAAGQQLLEQLGLETLCVTRGAKGVLAFNGRAEHRFLPAEAREVFDVTGAGDTFISTFAGLLIAGSPFFEAVEIANIASGIAVGKLGTATVSPWELLAHGGGPRKLVAAAEIAKVAASLREAGKRIVFTNGCFDLLHAGHIQYLQDSRAQGDLLIIGINSDDSVRRLKGPTRPVIGEEDRAHLLAALACVDYVVIFGEDTPLDLIRAIKPHVLTKGADYTVDTVVGHEDVLQWGGQVRLIPLKENRSTSGLIEKIRAGAGR
jgi:D-beta-D-heptose 7-phosphate kinase/D-beta-D-heptose 1-phosphate adenosyltransferase